MFNQKTSTWLDLHRRAFEEFGGVPETMVPDNLKAAVLRAVFGTEGDSELNRSYREFARYYGFKIDPTPPYAPKKKGKVESAVKYVKRNALAGREGEGITEANASLHRWRREIAGQRVHGTTGRCPFEVFVKEEQPTLKTLPTAPYEMTVWKRAKVHQDTHICFEGRLYSVPWRWVGKEVWVRATRTTLAIFGADVRIATHDPRGSGKRSTVESHLPEHRRDLRHRSMDYWLQRAACIGPQTGGLVREIFDSDDVLSQLRKVQHIVTHLEGLSPSESRGGQSSSSILWHLQLPGSQIHPGQSAGFRAAARSLDPTSRAGNASTVRPGCRRDARSAHGGHLRATLSDERRNPRVRRPMACLLSTHRVQLRTASTPWVRDHLGAPSGSAQRETKRGPRCRRPAWNRTVARFLSSSEFQPIRYCMASHSFWSVGIPALAYERITMSPIDDLVPLLEKLRLSGILQTLELRTTQAAEDNLAPAEFLSIHHPSSQRAPGRPVGCRQESSCPGTWATRLLPWSQGPVRHGARYARAAPRRTGRQ